MFKPALAAICLVASSLSVHAKTVQTAPATFPVIVHQRLNEGCELVQNARLLQYQEFVAIIPEGEGEESYSPDFGKGDFISLVESVPKEVMKATRKSGFDARSEPNGDAASLRVVGGVSCPKVEEAVGLANQQRAERRKQVQSRLHNIGGDVLPPEPIQQEQPKAPSNDTNTKSVDKPKGKQGTVLLLITIGVDGAIHQAKVARQLDTVLDQKAIEAVRQWQFSPARKKGLPVPVQTYVEVNFRLD